MYCRKGGKCSDRKVQSVRYRLHLRTPFPFDFEFFVVAIPLIWNLYTLNNGGAFMAPEPDDDDDETWVLFSAMNGNRAEMSPEAAGIAACLMTYSHHACRTECYAMTVHYYRLRDYALQHPECSAIMRIID